MIHRSPAGRRVAAPRAVAALVIAAALAAGCSTTGAAPSPGPAASSSAAAVPEYRGPRLPGMAATPVWAATGGRFTVHAVGDAFAVVKPEQKPAGDPAVDGKPSSIEFRDAATGAVRTTATTPIGTAWTGSWRGQPALYIAFQRVQRSDGLSAERREQVVTAYGSTGLELGAVTRPLDGNLFAVVNGWVITRPATDRQTATVADPDGTVRVTQRCSARIRCAVDVDLQHADLVEGSSRIPVVVGDLSFAAEDIDNRDRINPVRVVATDLNSGQRAWTTATVERPATAVPESSTTGAHAIPFRIADGKLVMAWCTDRGAGFGDRGEVLALHDPASGRLLRTGPEVGTQVGTITLEPGGTIAVVADAASQSHSLAWDLRTGQTIWRQHADEKPLIPAAIFGGVLIGDRRRSGDGSTSLPIAVDLRTKAVVDADPEDLRWPAVADTGQAALVVDGSSDDTTNGIYVFSPAR